MNKIFRVVLSVVIAVGVAVTGTLGTQQSFAQNNTEGNGIRVSPVRTDVTMNPGESRSITLTIQNITGASSEFQAVINDFVPKGEAGQPALILEADKYAPSHSLKRFIAKIPNVSVNKGEYKEVKAVITVPKDAAAGTIRADFAVSIDENAVHGSDSEAAAAREISYFFAATEVCARIR